MLRIGLKKVVFVYETKGKTFKALVESFYVHLEFLSIWIIGRHDPFEHIPSIVNLFFLHRAVINPYSSFYKMNFHLLSIFIFNCEPCVWYFVYLIDEFEKRAFFQ